MTLFVSAEGPVGQAVFRSRTFRCAIGRGGIATDKTEGDGITPIGEFDMIKALYRPDRGVPVDTSIGIAPIAATDGWCDDPAHADYNRPVSLPHAASCETLWRSDALYDLVVVTSHNSQPIIPGAGSAIFVHIAGGPDYPPTEGCVAFARDDLEAILREWIPGKDRLVIR
ncbi:MAG: L,D-peptidoglycan transpeptidase YkuD (ErfK/YbiS/YcfS/YnhG family) [Paracoccaceae bacterium]|jgi:L,D-peptidoglycan transpeptidase YkuD (ErfK/YbiS/YcfS/YnhG family)